jgi:hypothetical protein
LRHAAQSFRALGYEAVMVNCNPETVSTDHATSVRSTSSRSGPVLAVCERERPEGVVIQFGVRPAEAGARSRRRASGSSGRRSKRSTSPRTASASRRSATGSGSRCRRGGWPPAPTRRSR